MADRWSFGILVAELGSIYGSLLSGQPTVLPPAVPFRSYVAWLQERSETDARDYWDEALKGLGGASLVAPRPSATGQRGTATFSLSETFDLGQDTGTPVSALYDDHFKFTGELKKVVITLTD